MAKVVMYATAVCPYCIRAEQLLKRKGVTEIEKIRIDLEPARGDEMIARTGRRTGAHPAGGRRERAECFLIPATNLVEPEQAARRLTQAVQLSPIDQPRPGAPHILDVALNLGQRRGSIAPLQSIGLLRQPACQVAQADDVVAMIGHLWRRRARRQRHTNSDAENLA
jgi:hypothetical protein